MAQYNSNSLPRYAYLAIVLPFFTILLLLNIGNYYNIYESQKLHIIILIGLIASNFITLYIFFESINAIKYKQKLDLSLKEQERYKEKLYLINKHYDDTFNFLHSLLHICARITSSSNKGNIQDVNTQIKELSDLTFSKFNILNNNSTILNKIINQYSYEIFENKINFRSTLKTEDIALFDEKDTMKFFSYLLSSIINACNEIENDRYIILYSKKIGNKTVLQINYSSETEIDLDKSDIKNIFQKYHLLYQQQYDKAEKSCSLTIMY